jgi:hypothetical protein
MWENETVSAESWHLGALMSCLSRVSVLILSSEHHASTGFPYNFLSTFYTSTLSSFWRQKEDEEEEEEEEEEKG